MYTLSEIRELLEWYYSDIWEKTIDDILYDLRMSHKKVDHSQAEKRIQEVFDKLITP